jgi:hypothetical protein
MPLRYARSFRAAHPWPAQFAVADHPSRPDKMTSRLSVPSRRYPHVRVNVLDEGFSLTGFQVIRYGRFCMITKGGSQEFSMDGW